MRSWQLGKASRLVIEVATTPCVVQQPWAAKHAKQAFAPSRPAHDAFRGAVRALVNPANPSLAGTSRPYFPRGGPLPPPPPPGLEKSSSGWGGLDAGSNMLYPAQVVDGLVHMHAGGNLRKALEAVPVDEWSGVRVQPGGAYVTPAFELMNFDLIAHTPTPFWPEDAKTELESFLKWGNNITSCFVNGVNALHVPMSESKEPQPLAIALPLLGAGAAGAPAEACAEMAAQATSILAQELQHEGRGGPLLLRFVLPGEAELALVSRAFEEKFAATASPQA